VARQQHVVLFKFPRPLTQDEERFMFDSVRGWVGQIQGLTRLRLGKDVGGRSGGFDYLLLTEFEDEERMRAYFPHPLHKAFADWVADMRCEVIRVDYPLDDSTDLLSR
jgi:hypothetical protein